MNPVIAHIYLTEIIKKAKEIMPNYLNAVKIIKERRKQKQWHPDEGIEDPRDMQEIEPTTETQFD